AAGRGGQVDAATARPQANEARAAIRELVEARFNEPESLTPRAPRLRGRRAIGYTAPRTCMLKDYVFTSESVNEGHPDKVCDQISDAILDGFLAADPDSRVACEALIKTGLVVIAGEITSRGRVEFGEVAKEVIRDIS